MRVIRLQAENFKILKAIDIAPGEGPVVIGGRNEQGKSSVMDAIWVALSGKAAAPAKPIRAGEEECRISLDIGDYLIQRKFTDKGEGKVTDTLKLLDDRGRIVPSPQQVLNDLLGAIGFDPFAFTKMKAEDQAEQLLGLVPLPIDLEDFAREDAADYATRRERNRDVERLAAQIAGMPEHDVPEDAPNRDALADQLANAANINGAIERERAGRAENRSILIRLRENADAQRRFGEQRRADAAKLIEEAEKFEESATSYDRKADEDKAALEALPDLDTPVDTAALRQQMAEADQIAAQIASNARRAALVTERDRIKAEADAFTEAMDNRERQRREALGKAKMPVEGLGFAVNEKGKPVVTWGGLPFSQASTAAQIKASTAIAMAANPDLRIIRIKDGSLLDEDTMAAIVGMAEAEDVQLWIEVVGEGAAGIIIENGAVKGAPAADGDTGGDADKGAEKGSGGNPTKSKKPKAEQGGLL